MSFKKNKYSVIKKAISKELANFIFSYFKLKRKVYQTLLSSNYINPNLEIFGYYKDDQVPNTYSHYADIAMESLLVQLKPIMEKTTKLKLVETYSYARIYKKGDILHKHKDRPSCEISTTLNLGGDMWPIYIKNIQDKEVKISLEPGDMLVYSGCDLEHWRNKFNKKECAQVFLHYNNKHSNYGEENKFDNRPHLGLPANFKNF